ncbi:ninja-family protein AFP3-like [Gastrolobium bilobum]|uniref:ninja-family protein AFP3-like n=1 Tax=Gastrolobium bilobum TaxID=150636 RepID=UPI002AAFF6BC|nr:ninja-family protein AFP3-like [Gastrolobium bilobum]
MNNKILYDLLTSQSSQVHFFIFIILSYYLPSPLILSTLLPFGEGVRAIFIRDIHSSRVLFCSRISMEGVVFAGKLNKTKLPNKCELIDLTLKLSPCGQKTEEKWLIRSLTMAGEKANSTVVANGADNVLPFVPSLDRSCSLPLKTEKGLIRFGDLQTMRRVKTRNRFLLRRVAAVEPDKTLVVSPPPPAGAQQLAHSVYKLNTLANPSRDSWHDGRASSNVQTSPKKKNNCKLSPKAMLKEMSERPSDTKLESPAKKLKQVNPNLKGDAMEFVREMHSVTTTGDGPSGKRIEGLLYNYRRDQVCIVCVCHGSFLSPAEFVMHAGGKEVANPMKHISLCSNSF